MFTKAFIESLVFFDHNDAESTLQSVIISTTGDTENYEGPLGSAQCLP